MEAWRGHIDIWLADLKIRFLFPLRRAFLCAGLFCRGKARHRGHDGAGGPSGVRCGRHPAKGVILRHLALPGHVKDSFAVLDRMAAWNEADPGCFIPSVMSQYTPFYKAAEHGIGRRITTYEYRRW